MTTPYYNSRATKIAVVTNGEGYFEMACPHLSSSEFGGSGSNRGRQEGVEDRTSSNTGAVAQATRNLRYCLPFILLQQFVGFPLRRARVLIAETVCDYGLPPSINNSIKEHWPTCSLK
ncbi:Cupincin [Camellia lanceoleosa]|uniref:Cupincin n=1 Tax=Camellia lanceoleosa TaxID=1840588 RepID=A0ACC0GM72_9ERIC|nr:Cupincin [Camellia lanceoleosa]